MKTSSEESLKRGKILYELLQIFSEIDKEEKVKDSISSVHGEKKEYNI